MPYIPTDWIINKENENHIHDLLDQLDIDVRLVGDKTEENVIKELKEMGETVIVKKLEEGEISFGA